MSPAPGIIQDLQTRFGPAFLGEQKTAEGMPTAWIDPGQIKPVLAYLRDDAPRPYRMLLDLTAIDERERANRDTQPASHFTMVYQLLSLEGNADIRIKAPLTGQEPRIDSVADLWPNADWYEREVWDMFGVRFAGRDSLRRLLMPPWWQGHPLRREHYARATERPGMVLTQARQQAMESDLEFQPEQWGMARQGKDFEYMFLNVGPHHPGTHGLLRLILQLDGQEIRDMVVDIGYHHRGAEKMGERQSWHTYIPYTDRVDYLSGVANNLPYLLAVEKLAGIDVPARAQVIRVMTTEIFRIISHLVYYGTFSQDLGQMSPVFFLFNDRERALDIIEAFTGARMHPGWFRMGGVAMDLPEGWEKLVSDFLAYFPPKLREYDRMILRNRIFRARTVGIGEMSAEEAVAWGATGPMLRSAGLAWDWRKKRPYSGYEQFDFEVPIGRRGDCYDRAVVHVEEMRQSMRIIEQCLHNMPAGDYRSRHPLALPLKEYTLRDIETLIAHFLHVSWGPVIPPGECCVTTENSKGANGYYLVSDGGTTSYRTRIRTPSFAHMQMLPLLSRGLTISDLIAILGSVDFVLADVDR